MTSEGARMTYLDRRRAATLGALLIIFLLGMGLRLYQLDGDSLWLDEIKTAIYSRKELLQIPAAQARESVHPPLHYLLVHSFMALMGTSDWVIRLPSALFGSVSIVLAYKLGESFWTRKEGLIGAFLLAVNAYHVHYSQEARHYAVMVFFVLFSLVFLILALRRGSSGSWLGFALCSSLGIYTHYFAFLVLPAQVVFAVWVIWKGRPPSPVEQLSSPLRPRRQTLALVASLLAVGISYIPWLPAMQQQLLKPAIGFRGFGGIRESAAGLSVEFFHDLLKNYTGWEGVALLLLLALFMTGLSRCRPEHGLLLGLWVVTPFTFLAVVQASHWFGARYTIFILPICLLLVGKGICTSATCLERPLRSLKGYRRSSAVLLPSLVILLGLLNVSPLRDYYAFQNEDWRGAAEYLAASVTPGDAIIVDSTRYGPGDDADRVTKSLPYYLEACGATGTSLFRVQQTLWKQLTEWDQWNGRLWAVLWHPNKPAAAPTGQTVELKNLSIVRLQEPSGQTLQDTERLLQLLLEMIPEGEAQFDVHLAMADLYIRTGRPEEADAQLQLASVLMPENPTASASLETERAPLDQLSHALDGMQYPLWHSFGDQVALLGYDLSPESLEAGGTIGLTLWWQAVANMDRDYTTFVHLIGPAGRIWAQEDILLRDDQRPTSTWRPGELVKGDLHMRIPGDLPPGEYTLMLGLYYWETGERLPVWDKEGQRLAGDIVEVQQMEVTESGD